MAQHLNLCTEIEETRCEIVTAINSINARRGLPAYLLDGILSSILAEVRNQKTAEMIIAINHEENEEEGEEHAETENQSQDGESGCNSDCGSGTERHRERN